MGQLPSQPKQFGDDDDEDEGSDLSEDEDDDDDDDEASGGAVEGLVLGYNSNFTLKYSYISQSGSISRA